MNHFYLAHKSEIRASGVYFKAEFWLRNPSGAEVPVGPHVEPGPGAPEHPSPSPHARPPPSPPSPPAPSTPPPRSGPSDASRVVRRSRRISIQEAPAEGEYAKKE